MFGEKLEWNVKVILDGRVGMASYYGFATKEEAEQEAEKWRNCGLVTDSIEVTNDW